MFSMQAVIVLWSLPTDRLCLDLEDMASWSSLSVDGVHAAAGWREMRSRADYARCRELLHAIQRSQMLFHVEDKKSCSFTARQLESASGRWRIYVHKIETEVGDSYLHCRGLLYALNATRRSLSTLPSSLPSLAYTPSKHVPVQSSRRDTYSKTHAHCISVQFPVLTSTRQLGYSTRSHNLSARVRRHWIGRR